MYHSITIGTLDIRLDETTNTNMSYINGKNTWEDWHLIPSSRPSVALPEANLNAVDIPFRDGALDISEAVTGYTTYKNRSGSWEFYIVNDYHYWVTLKQEITNYLHGKKMCVVLEDDPEYYYEGRITVSEFKSQKVNSTITLNYNLLPYKRRIQSIGETWLWDPFNFETGIVSEASSYTVTHGTTTEVTIIGGRMRVVPIINASNSRISVSKNGVDYYKLAEGDNELSELVTDEGENVYRFTCSSGSGNVVITYREGSL